MGAVLRKIKNALGGQRRLFLYFWAYAAASKLRFQRSASTKVVMFRLDLVGDCTMFTSSAYAIREHFKDREMTVICLAPCKPIFERLGIFDRIIAVDFKPDAIDYGKLKQLCREVRKEQYDVLLQPQISKYPLADVLGAAIKCNRRIAIQPKPGNSSASWIKKTNFLYDEFIPVPDGIVSEFDYYGAFVKGLCGAGYKTTCPHIPYHEQHFVEGNYYVLYPGGSLSQKFWPSERFARIADHIFARTGLSGVILGVASEQWVSDMLKSNLDIRTSMAMIDLTGRTSIPDVIDIIGNAKLVVSNDTSGVHIACATRTPSVANVGGWLFGRFLPYHIEDVKPEDKLPKVAHADMPCFHCDWEWSIVGKRNPECLEHLKKGEPSSCISGVTYEQICALVDEVIEEEGLC